MTAACSLAIAMAARVPLARPPTAVIIDYIDQHRDLFRVAPICRVMQVAPST